MSRFALLDDAIVTLRRHGLAPKIEQGPHIKVRFTNQLGSHCILIVSRSPSSQRAIKKNRAQLHRLMRRPAR
jgi:hypothetical protein